MSTKLARLSWTIVLALAARAPGAAAIEPGQLLGYRCADAYAFRARAHEHFAVLETSGGIVVLPRVIAASGSRYSDGRTTFWPWRDEARLETTDAQRPGCRLEGPAGDTPPRQGWPDGAAAVLDRFAGPWTTRLTMRRPGPPEAVVQGHGRGEGAWTLGGRYFLYRTIGSDQTEELQIMTYDPRERVYRQWVFDSAGYRHEATGRWDPISSTLRWEGPDLVIEDRWVGADRLDWTLRRRDASGRLLQAIEGRLTRAD